MDVVDYCLRDVMLTRRLFCAQCKTTARSNIPRTGEIVKDSRAEDMRLTEEQWQQIIADRIQKRQRESASFQAAHPLPQVTKKKNGGVNWALFASETHGRPNKTVVSIENDYLKGRLAWSRNSSGRL